AGLESITLRIEEAAVHEGEGGHAKDLVLAAAQERNVIRVRGTELLGIPCLTPVAEEDDSEAHHDAHDAVEEEELWAQEIKGIHETRNERARSSIRVTSLRMSRTVLPAVSEGRESFSRASEMRAGRFSRAGSSNGEATC